MPTILTVDDSSSIRTIVGKCLRELGFELEQAEDGARALALLEQVRVDLVLLDVTMPVMDGPTMLKALRARGDRTPVIMLTSESKRSIVAGALQLGIEDYMLKPFKPDELRAKVCKALGLPAPGGPATVEARPPAAAPAPPPARPAIDVLVVDDMEAVHRKLRALLPEHVSLRGALDAAEAIARCEELAAHVVLVDTVIPGVDPAALVGRLRALVPRAAFLALALRTGGDPRAALTAAGFDDVVAKPFDADGIAALVGRVYDAREPLAIDGELVTASGCDARDDRLERHYARLRAAVKDALERLAAACHERVILDLRQVPLRAERTVHMIIDVDREAQRLGLQLLLVGTAETASLLRRVADTALVPVFDTVDHARGMAA